MPGGAVGRGGDDPAAGRVLLVDRHGGQVEPVHRLGGVAGRAQPFVDPGGPAAHAQRAGEGAAGAAARVDALPHHAPDLHQPRAHLRLVADDGLVGQHELGDVAPVLAQRSSRSAAVSKG